MSYGGMTTTAIDRFRPGRPRVVTALVVALFLSTVAVPRILGRGTNVRLKLMIEALLFAIVLGAIGLIVLSRRQVRLDATYSPILALFVGFLALSVWATVNGVLRGHSLSYVSGDFFKFAAPAATVLLLYLIADSQSLEAALVYVHHILFVLILAVLGLYVSGFLPPNHRPGLIYHFPTLLVVAGWLRRREQAATRVTFPTLILISVPLVYYSQSLSLLINIIAIVCLTILYYHWGEKIHFRELGIATVIGGIILFLLFLASSQVSPEQWRESGYLGQKLSVIFIDHGIYERLILLGGSRAAEPFGVLNAIDDGVLEFLFGAGMGSTFVSTSPFGDPVWAERDHFVHSGLWESVLRTGIVGGGIYLGLLLSYFHVGVRIRKESYLGALVAASATYTLLLSPFGTKLLGPDFFLYVFFAYGLVRWSERRQKESKRNQVGGQNLV